MKMADIFLCSTGNIGVKNWNGATTDILHLLSYELFAVFLLLRAIQCDLTTTMILDIKQTPFISTGLSPYKENLSVQYKDSARTAQ
jgi:hypothetical protein